MVSPLKSLFGRRGNNQGLLTGLPSQANPGTLIRHLLMGADARLGEVRGLGCLELCLMPRDAACQYWASCPGTLPVSTGIWSTQMAISGR